MDRTKKLVVVDWEPPNPHAPEKSTTDRLVYTIDLNALEEVSPTDPTLAPLLPLIDNNVAFAAVPENFGEGCACYLLNLSSLKK